MLTFQNILVVSKYYARITLKRLAQLLCLSLEVCNGSCGFVLLAFLSWFGGIPEKFMFLRSEASRGLWLAGSVCAAVVHLLPQAVLFVFHY